MMHNKMKKFLQILKVELEELEDELIMFGEMHQQRERSGEITTYVFRENMNLIKNEISGLQEILRSVDSFVPARYRSFEEMVEDLDRKIKERLRESEHADAAYELVKRKLQKVHRYIRDET
jgi:hypothetical protein